MDLWHAEEAAQKAAQEAADKRERRARVAAQMAEDNRRQLELKVIFAVAEFWLCGRLMGGS